MDDFTRETLTFLQTKVDNGEEMGEHQVEMYYICLERKRIARECSYCTLRFASSLLLR